MRGAQQPERCLLAPVVREMLSFASPFNDLFTMSFFLYEFFRAHLETEKANEGGGCTEDHELLWHPLDDAKAEKPKKPKKVGDSRRSRALDLLCLPCQVPIKKPKVGFNANEKRILRSMNMPMNAWRGQFPK